MAVYLGEIKRKYPVSLIHIFDKNAKSMNEIKLEKTVLYIDDKAVKDTLVIYGGGGYDGCIVQYNACYFDSEGVFHDIFSSGMKGCDTLDKIVEKLKTIEEDAGRWFGTELIPIGTEAELGNFSVLAKEHAPELMVRIGKFMKTTFSIILTTNCDVCEQSFSLSSMVVDRLKHVNGTPIQYATQLKCTTCYEKDNPTCCSCGESLSGEEAEYCDELYCR